MTEKRSQARWDFFVTPSGIYWLPRADWDKHYDQMVEQILMWREWL